ncbi:MAG: hypothetical protein WD768_18505 [Phycisphaeraceae bacterium]
MNIKLAYLGRSALSAIGSGQLLNLAPNLAREPVSFDAALKQPLRFREAMSALHDVVISDLRFQPRDKSAYDEWKKNESLRVETLRRETHKKAKEEILSRRSEVPKDLERTYNKLRKHYWAARQKYSNYLYHNDIELWRRLMPCDPVITIADDVAFFECFSADESTYGCLTLARDEAFGHCDNLQFGTTNVDYSWDLYNNFQSLRSYRETRFRVDPAGFAVATTGNLDYREEKIDLPPSWLKGFMQVQQAMALPATRVSLSREAVYSLLVWLKRNKAKSSPRAIRFELNEGKPPRLVLEPWGTVIESLGTVYDGPTVEPIRVWGRQRLLVLARLLHVTEKFDVHLLGTGLPHFWVAQMGEMRLTLGLSGWTTNDWTAGSALDLILPPAEPSPDLIQQIARLLKADRAASFDTITRHTSANPAEVLAGLGHLAHSGQVIRDLSAGVYRYRQIMPQALGEEQLGPPSPELVAAKELLRWQRVKITEKKELDRGAVLLIGQVENQKPEVMIDGDGRIKRGKCGCSHYFKYSFRNGPCRHMIAMHRLLLGMSEGGEKETKGALLDSWFSGLRGRWR